ncbi:alpha/beta fold hydrolase [Acetobacter orleanensis]|uniref:Alpha/beta hydrolase n=1 Tax=Acetobacter orleanensis TaxID=104099 RepID=A0A4Y3TIX8_9PROT|nr:alpha/beta hydrolase [Acetobacter orleanensis]KXV62044.1 hypothetical protein AD949_12340 [Acetobacter orleanensis]PCD80378.1 alpha/beta hydrolase [Acetobacter orleanensis]GAN68864.1 hypothetical protein Abol_024_003 [Acetobacter orleanensis JCM 7639]GBR30918.1 hypothetical protein AA0473_2399 [Acetobacter orleanensis NRIC 0473]GEB81728.1 alpha/beta hydrolase [Acetobacter orleanensis]
MTTLPVVFAHGWACGPDVWGPVLAALDLPSPCVLDLGYFGASQQEAHKQVEVLRKAEQPVLVVGHSLGFLWLLSQGDWPEGSAFLGLNAFGCFAGSENFPQGVPPRVLARMRSGLTRDAAQVVTQFRTQCGLGPVTADVVCEPALQEGLTDLMTLDARPVLAHLREKGSTVKVLAGEQDPIVSPNMTQASFPSGVPIDWQAEGGHMLPLTHPHICAGVVRSMVSHMVENS